MRLIRSSSSGDPVVRNAYRLMCAGMKRDSEIDLVFNGVVRLLSTITQSKSSYFSTRIVSLFEMSSFIFAIL